MRRQSHPHGSAVDESLLTEHLLRTEDSTLSTGTETILIIDDDDALRGLMEKMFTSLGYRALTAECGRTGLDVFAVQLDNQVSIPDLVVLDMTLPDLPSREVLTQLRRRYADTRVVVSSGYHDEDAIVETLGQKPDGFLPKPFSLSEAARVMREVLDSR